MRLRDIARFCVIALTGFASLAAAATYDPRETFAPLTPPPTYGQVLIAVP